jgi:hypothetical protein
MGEVDGPEDEPQRLRRYLIALSAVNKQLYDQLESGAGAARVVETTGWLEQLRQRGDGSEPFLVRSPGRGSFLVEGRMRREVKAGMLFDALRAIVPVREIADTELDAQEHGPPVEVMRGPSGPAFVVVGGRRYPLRGLPLPHAVSGEDMAAFPEGPELRVGAAPPKRDVDRARDLVKKKGLVRGSASVTRRTMARLRRKLSKRSH